MATFMAYQTRGLTSSPPLLEDENVIINGQASYFLNDKGTVGWLYLTDKRLLFISHSANPQLKDQSIPIHDIQQVAIAKSFGIFPNRLHLIRKHGDKERFVVENLRSWIEQIEERRNKYLEYQEAPPAGLFE